eukprot:TRINITY_DN23498_c0_g1_i1.p1 TRINITY_DN23498_c0_g1~~TRINITY_DN23498_c0_g1_i1.p1  ORF type:complete len:295 (+),score=55.72 TRINITY_DN23498_c0_g1_i1:61-885(+)
MCIRDRRNALLMQINEYGQAPKQLFKKAHPERKKLERSQAIYYSMQSLRNISAYMLFRVRHSENSRVASLFVFGETRKFGVGVHSGLSSFKRVFTQKEGVNEYQSLIGVTIKGSTFVSVKMNKILSWTSFYNHFVMMNHHPERPATVHVFENLQDCTCVAVLDETGKHLITGGRDGTLYVYTLKKRKIDLSKTKKGSLTESKPPETKGGQCVAESKRKQSDEVGCAQVHGNQLQRELGEISFVAYSRRRELQDCLLYTSPSPRDGLLSRMPSSA